MVKRIVVGVLQENCYLVWDKQSKKAVVIDPGDEGAFIENEIEKLQLNPILIVNTHYHFDHIGANGYLKKKYNIPIAISKIDAQYLQKSHLDGIQFMINTEASPKADILLSENDTISFGSINFNILETPGHTKGSICLYSQEEKILFSGDTLFLESVGRWDLKGGNKEELFRSLDRLLELPKDTIVYPGHGDQTTIKHELLNNPYKKGVL
jgi:hydroxyacylglutathione hydrolase